MMFAGPGAGLSESYWLMAPHRMIRAWSLIRASTASSVSPPTLSKYTSMPFGQVRLSPPEMDSAR